MSIERLSPNPVEFLSRISPEKFSQACDSMVDFQVPQELYSKIADSITKDNRIVTLVTTHQSYFELEAERKFCQELNQVTGEKISSFLIYSAPAVESNIGAIFESRKSVYNDSHLTMLGIVRESDRNHPKYKQKITPKMEEENCSNLKTLVRAMHEGGCLIITPLEGTLNSGRVNLETNKINGIKATDKDEALTRMVKKNSLIIPCGIDGGYKVIDPDKHQPTPEFIKAFSSPPSEKLVIFKANKLIDPTKDYPGQTIPEMCHQIIIEVAKNVSFDARGDYKFFC